MGDQVLISSRIMLRFLPFVTLLASVAIVGAKWSGEWSSEEYGGYKPTYGGYKPYPYNGGNNQSPLAGILALLAGAGSTNAVPGAGVSQFPGTIGVIGANGVPIATGTTGIGTGTLPVRLDS